MAFRSDLHGWRPGRVEGHVIDPDQPDRRWVVSLCVNGQTVAHLRADLAVDAPGLPQDCGFAFDVNLAICDPGDLVAVTIANDGTVLGQLTVGDPEAWLDPAGRSRAGQVRYAGGLLLTGTLDNGVTAAPSYEVLAFFGDQIVGRTRMYSWQHIDDPAHPVGRAVAFDLMIDPALADGRTRRLRIETSTGMPVGAGVLDVTVWPDRMRRALRKVMPDGDTAGELAFAALGELGLPLSAYGDAYPGLTRAAAAPPDNRRLPDGGVLAATGVDDWVMVHHAAVKPVAQLPDWKADPQTGLVVFDLAVMRGRRHYPLLFPAFDHERALEQGYPALLMLVRAAVVERALSRGAASVFAVLIEALRDLDRDRVLHVPLPGGVLDLAGLDGAKAALADALADADLPAGTQITPVMGGGLPAVRILRRTNSLEVSVIMAAPGRGADLPVTAQELVARNAGVAIDLLIVDDGSAEPDMLAELERKGAQVLEYEGADNPALMANLAADHARSPLLCLVTPGVRFPVEGVLEELLGRLAAPGVAAAGPMIAWPSGVVRDGGWHLDQRAGALQAMTDRLVDDEGPQGLMRVAREVAGLSAACLMTRADVFQAMGGFDDRRFANHLFAVDYCLRLWSNGHRVVFTPHVHAVHPADPRDRMPENSPAARVFQRETDLFHMQWRDAILADPFGHPLSLSGGLPYRALSNTHRAPKPRRATVPPAADLPGWIR